MRRVRLSLAATLVASLLLSACGEGDEASKEQVQEKAAASKGTGNASVLESTWPLTGLPVKGEQSSALDHPVFVVKIDNTSSSAPQAGLGTADLVVEELVEGGSTRLATFFYSRMPATTGPVRSMRASDIGIVKPVKGEMVASGAAGVTLRRLDKAGLKFYEEGAAGFYRDNSRRAPYNLMVNLEDLAESVEVDEPRPDDYLPWGEAKDLPKGQPARKVAASFSGGHTTTWNFRSGEYHNANTHAAKGDQFVADNVLVLRVPVGDAGYRDPAGNPVPETKFVGKGQAMLFHDGRLVRGTWSKSQLDAPLRLKTKAGTLKVPAGRTWIELVPRGSGAGVSVGN